MNQTILRMWLTKISLFPCLFLLTLTGCDNYSQVEIYPPLAENFAATEQYPQGYSDVKMGDYLMRVSGEVTKHVSPNGSLRIYASWPEFEVNVGGKMFRSSGVQSSIDTIEMFFWPPRRGPSEKAPYIAGEEHKANIMRAIKSREGRWFKSEEFPGYWELLNGNGKPRIYKSMDTSIAGPFGFPVVIGCDTFNLDVEWDQMSRDYTTWDQSDWDKADKKLHLPTCEIRPKWPDGHQVRIRFKRKHMQDAVQIYQKVIALHDSLIINTSKPELPNGDKQ